MARFNGVELSPESMQKAREFFASNAQKCIEDVERGDAKVNDPVLYLESCRVRASEALSGQYDHTLTMLQRAYFEQTGESVALLPPRPKSVGMRL